MWLVVVVVAVAVQGFQKKTRQRVDPDGRMLHYCCEDDPKTDARE